MIGVLRTLCCLFGALSLLFVVETSTVAAENSRAAGIDNKVSSPAAGAMAENPSLAMTDQEKVWLAEHKIIRVAFDGYFPPYSFFNDEGEFEGLAVDLIRLLAERLGIVIEISPKAVWKDLYEAAQGREVDVVATMGHNQEREEWFAFTQPYIFKSLVIMTREETTSIEKPEDLARKRVALVEKYQYVQPILLQYPSIKPYPVDTMLDGLNAVAVGKADAAITFIGAAHYLKTKYQLANLKFAAVFERDRFTESIAVRKDWPELASLLDTALDTISNQEMHVLQKKWLPAEETGRGKIVLSKEEKVWIRDHPVLRLGVNPESAPYAYRGEDGTFIGIASEYIKLLNERLGLNMQVVPDLTWKEVVGKAKRQEIDVLPAVAINEERRTFLGFTVPYLNFYRVIITRKDAPFLTGIEDLRGLKVAVQTDTAHEAYLKEYTEIKPFACKTLQEALLAVSVGKADALVHNLSSATFWITALNLTNLKVAAPLSEGDGTLHIAVRKDWPELVAILNKGLASISPEEKMELQRRWLALEYTSGIERRTVYNYLAALLGLILLAALVFTLWNRELKKQVRQKTEELQQELAEREKTTAALQENEECFRSIFNATNDALFIHDLKTGKIVDVNQKVKEMYGFSREEALRFDIGDISSGVPPYTQEEADGWMRKAAGGEPQLFEWQAKDKSGHLFWIEVNMRCATIGPVERIIVSARDIGERKEMVSALHLSEEKFARTFRNIPEAVSLTLVANGQFIEVNDSFLRLSGYGLDEIIGHTTFELGLWANPADRQQYLELLQKSGRVTNMEADFHKKSGEIMRSLVSGDIIQVNSSACILTVIHDITERKQVELELAQYRIHLEEMVQDRTSDLEGSQHALLNIVEDLNQKTTELEVANSRLKELDRLKSMFIASMSHELRTPLNSIIGFSGIILQGMSGTINEEQRDQLGRVFRAGKHLLSLITDVIDIAKIESGRISSYVEDFALHALIDEAIGQVRSQAADKGLVLVEKLPEYPLLLHSDRKRLLQCLLNYLSNAVKFSEQGMVTVTAGLQRGTGAEEWLEITVSDTGIGIREEDKALLFKSFVRLESHLKIGTPGTGLGLYLTRKLATEVLGGDVSVESKEGEGSTFTLRIPRLLKIENNSIAELPAGTG